MRTQLIITFVAAAIALGCALAGASQAADKQKNTTGLPSYPNDPGGSMDGVAREIPNGQHCTHYSSNTPDALAKVEEWYKRSLPNAKVEDINKDSLYGSYFKLEGIKLLAGNDIVNIYRTTDQKDTSIELFKCGDVAAVRS